MEVCLLFTTLMVTFFLKSDQFIKTGYHIPNHSIAVSQALIHVY